MTGKEALNKLQHNLDGKLKGNELVECYKTISKDLDDLEALKNPMYEENDGDYLLQSHAYYNENYGELVYGCSMYKWDGTYREEKLSPTSKKTYKFKNWVECFHTGSAKKHLTIKKVLEMISVLTSNDETKTKGGERNEIKESDTSV